MEKLVSIVLLIILGESAPALRAQSILPGQKLVIDFSFSAPPIAQDGQPIDFVYFLAGASFIDFTGSVTFRLYDGTTLLGSATTFDHRADWRFAPANSDWIDAATTIVDFDSIADGTIQGRFEFVPKFLNPGPNSSVFVGGFSVITGDAISPGQYWSGPAPSSITSQVVPLPESSDSALLLLIGILSLVGIFPRTHSHLYS
jgi:hypothetical protein